MNRKSIKAGFERKLKNVLIQLGYKKSYKGNRYSKLVYGKWIISFMINEDVYVITDLKLYLSFFEDIYDQKDVDTLQFAYNEMINDTLKIRSILNDN